MDAEPVTVEQKTNTSLEERACEVLGREPVRAIILVFSGVEHYNAELTSLEKRRLGLEETIFGQVDRGGQINNQQVYELLEANFRIECFEQAQAAWAESDALGREIINPDIDVKRISEDRGNSALLSAQELAHAGRAMFAAAMAEPDTAQVVQYFERMSEAIARDVTFAEEGQRDGLVQNLMPTRDTGMFTSEEIEEKRKIRDARQQARDAATKVRGENYGKLALKLRYPEK